MTIFVGAAGSFPAMAQRSLRTELLTIKFAAPLEPRRGAGHCSDADNCEQGADANKGKCLHDMGEHSLFAPQVKYGTL